jgi:holo-[acyl-carrier protein] synthase
MKYKIEDSLNTVTKNHLITVGNDLVFLPDFKNALTADFKIKVYTEQEIIYCDKFDNALVRYASTWAAKEAVYKALKQLSNKTLGWKKIEISREKIAGKPTVILHQTKNNYNISLSISHDGDYAWAIAIIN